MAAASLHSAGLAWLPGLSLTPGSPLGSSGGVEQAALVGLASLAIGLRIGVLLRRCSRSARAYHGVYLKDEEEVEVESEVEVDNKSDAGRTGGLLVIQGSGVRSNDRIVSVRHGTTVVA